MRIQLCDRQQKGQHTPAGPIAKHDRRNPHRLWPSDKAHPTLDRISIVADYLDAAKVKAKRVFDTLGRGEMLADARMGRNRRDALVGLGVADGNQCLTATFTWHNLTPPLGRSVGILIEVGKSPSVGFRPIF